MRYHPTLDNIDLYTLHLIAPIDPIHASATIWHKEQDKMVCTYSVRSKQETNWRMELGRDRLLHEQYARTASYLVCLTSKRKHACTIIRGVPYKKRRGILVVAWGSCSRGIYTPCTMVRRIAAGSGLSLCWSPPPPCLSGSAKLSPTPQRQTYSWNLGVRCRNAPDRLNRQLTSPLPQHFPY